MDLEQAAQRAWKRACQLIGIKRECPEVPQLAHCGGDTASQRIVKEAQLVQECQLFKAVRDMASVLVVVEVQCPQVFQGAEKRKERCPPNG